MLLTTKIITTIFQFLWFKNGDDDYLVPVFCKL